MRIALQAFLDGVLKFGAFACKAPAVRLVPEFISAIRFGKFGVDGSDVAFEGGESCLERGQFAASWDLSDF